jgi:hypothetical protein
MIRENMAVWNMAFWTLLSPPRADSKFFESMGQLEWVAP